MGRYFDKFNKIIYDLDGTRSGNYTVLTNIFVRFDILNSVKTNDTVFYPYLIQEGDTPEMIADKYYGDSQFFWVVLYMNDIMDPFYDWPLNYQDFTKYIVAKYGSIAVSQETVHHYEKQVLRTDSLSGKSTTSKMVIDPTTYASLPSSVFESVNLTDGTTVSITTTKNAVIAFDWEVEQNENKRSIKLLKREYIERLRNNFDLITERLPQVAPSVLNEL